MYRMEAQTYVVAEGVPREQIQAAIIEVLQGNEWSAHLNSKGVIRADLAIQGGKHSMAIAIEVDLDYFAIDYLTSYNLGYRKGKCSSFGDGNTQNAPETPSLGEDPECEIIHPIYNEKVRMLVDRIRGRVSGLEAGGASRSERLASSIPVQLVADELLKLKQLLDDGALTQSEFTRLKQSLLGDLWEESPRE